MATRGQTRFLPPGGILDLYLASAFLRIFFSSLLIITMLFMIVDFFDRASTIFESGASLWTVARYVFYKIPLSVSRIIGFATLFSTLFGLGMLARSHEITAMRASGLSVQRVALPLVGLSFAICAATFFLNESLVPAFAHRADTIYKSEIKNKQQQSLFGNRDIWLRGDNHEGRYVIADIRMDHDFPTERRAFFEPAGNPGGTVLIHKQPDDIWRVDYQLREGESEADALKEENIRARALRNSFVTLG
jgi:lipopolysaccharide export LptBFGC system permease protein LptF